MYRIAIAVMVAALPGAAVLGESPGATSTASTQATGPTIHTEDVDLFYKVYSAAGGHPSADQLQHDYLDPGSDGLHQFAKLRNITGARIADTLEKHPELYSGAKRCMAALPTVRRRLEVALHELARLYPAARFPPITIAVGRGKPVGVATSTSGVLIGLEALCATDWVNPNVEDRFVHTLAHEYAHVQQTPALADDEHPTVLEATLIEGGAEFIAELISGGVGYSHLARWTLGREKEFETAFVADEDKTDLSNWLYNTNPQEVNPAKPGDLGYWVGYRITKSYYQHVADERQAVREILEMTDPKAFLAKSGWYPGIVFGTETTTAVDPKRQAGVGP